MTKLKSDIDPKLSDTMIQQLERRHISTITQFIDEDPEKLAIFTGLLLKDVLDVKRTILQKYGGFIRNACDLLEIELNNIIPTNLLSLDNLLKGGLYPGQIYEVCGISSSGKTQLCLTIASNIALRSNSLVRYIDTKKDFCGSRIEEILLRKNCSKQVIDEALDHIRVCTIKNLHQLLKVLRWLTIALKGETEQCRTRIIIIDSLPAIIFMLSNDHKLTIQLNHLANMCHFIANEFHLSIITVNLVTQWSFSGETKAASTSTSENHIGVVSTLGRYWEGVPNTRLLIKKLEHGNRKISVLKSFQLETNITRTFSISSGGVSCS
ncbi:PREDICTED: DNA repair protein RAD51 homolog 4 [Dufourea novaeangliae]|uniref:DNA repair protein RAD51 homolog 4 n=1 Tax=Dufourea novaeangliae TaxID=178035 RepID=UPI000766F203|nr:PREDICTED: DNA repair protein RAD51 homolog 4 [Dufourea novaeangliae]